MTISLNKYGGFYFFFSGALEMALLWAWFFLPEVISGNSLESADDVFQSSWYIIGRKVVSLSPEHTETTLRTKKLRKIAKRLWERQRDIK